MFFLHYQVFWTDFCIMMRNSLLCTMKKFKILLLAAFVYFLSSAYLHNNNEDLTKLIVKAMVNYEKLKEDTPDTYEVMDSWLPDLGIRPKYAILKPVMGKKVIEGITGVNIFNSGPHADDINYNASSIGHYNPEFLNLANETLEQLFEDPEFVAEAREFYERRFKNMLRAYSITHHILHHTWRVNFEDIKKEYSSHLKSGNIPQNYLYYVFGSASRDIESLGYSYFEAESALGFWLRRSIDGTDQQFLDLLNIIYKYLDPQFYKVFELKNNLIGVWTNGAESYGISYFGEDYIAFEGASLHEGGYGFRIVMDEEVEIFNYVDETAIIIRDTHGEIKSWYRKMNPSIGLYKFALINKTNHQLSGTYIREDNGKKVVFFQNRFEVEGLSDGTNYLYAIDEIEQPMDLIYFKNKEGYAYKKSGKGLLLFKAVEGNEFWDIDSNNSTSLLKVDGGSFNNSRKLPGNYPIVSTEILTPVALSYYSKYELKIMRNEIFARYGYPFNSSEMKEYFSKQNWYVRGTSDAVNNLTPLERLNVELIQFEEKSER